MAAAIAVVATLLAYSRGLRFPFALDDYTYLIPAAGLEAPAAGLRRWLAVRGYYELGLAAFGPSPAGWHAVNFALHAANAVWVYAIARRLGVARTAAWTATGVFAASPIAFTVLYWIACIQELGSGFFVLAATYAALDAHRRWIAVPLFAVAILFKESVVAAPLALWPLVGKRRTRLVLVLLATGAAVFLATGLQKRMFDSNPSSPYATAYDLTILVHLLTQLVWFLAPWRTYPDRIAGPDAELVLPGILAVAAGCIVVALGRGRSTRPVLLASAWFVALLLPVLPLRAHSYAYYAYLPQIGFLVLLGMALQSVAARIPLGARPAPSAVAAGALAIAAAIVFADRNARTHETLMLENSQIPHDSVMRMGFLAGDVARQLHQAQLPDSVQRIVLIGLPLELGNIALTPGTKPAPGMVRKRSRPVELAMRNGNFVPLHFAGRTGGYQDSLAARDEAPDTAIFLSSGFSKLERLPDAAEAYCVLAQGRLMVGDAAAALPELESAVRLRPDHPVGRVLLARLLVDKGDLGRAEALIRDYDERDAPEALRAQLEAVRRAVAAER